MEKYIFTKRKHLNKKLLPGIFCLFLALAGAPGAVRAQSDPALRLLREKLDTLAAAEASGLRQQADISVVNTSVQEFLRGLAEVHQLNISISPAVQVNVTNNFTKVQVKDLLYYLCREYNLRIRFTGNIMTFYQPVPVQKPRQIKKIGLAYDKQNDLLTADLQQDSLLAFARQVTELTGKNVICSPRYHILSVYSFFQKSPAGKYTG